MVTSIRVGTPVRVYDAEWDYSYIGRVTGELTAAGETYYFLRDGAYAVKFATAGNVTPRAIVGDRATAHRPVNRRAYYLGFAYIGLVYGELDRGQIVNVRAHNAKLHGDEPGQRAVNARQRRVRYARRDRHAEQIASDRWQAAMEIAHNVQ